MKKSVQNSSRSVPHRLEVAYRAVNEGQGGCYQGLTCVVPMLVEDGTLGRAAEPREMMGLQLVELLTRETLEGVVVPLPLTMISLVEEHGDLRCSPAPTLPPLNGSCPNLAGLPA